MAKNASGQNEGVEGATSRDGVAESPTDGDGKRDGVSKRSKSGHGTRVGVNSRKIVLVRTDVEAFDDNWDKLDRCKVLSQS